MSTPSSMEYTTCTVPMKVPTAYKNFLTMLYRSIGLDFLWMRNPYVPMKWEFLFKKCQLLLFPYMHWDQKSQSYRIHTSHRDMYVEKPIGIGSIQSTFIDYNYLVPLVKKNGVIVDAGAHIGEFSLVSEFLLQAKTIYSFEPVKTSFELLKKNTHSKTFYGAICSGATTDIYIPEHTVMASGAKDFTASHHETVPCISPNSIPELRAEPIIHLFKIDVEGMEHDVLESSTEILKKSQYIMMELSINRPTNESALTTIQFLQSTLPHVELIHIGKVFEDTKTTYSVDLLFKNNTIT